MKTTLILTDWAYINCVVNNAPDGFIPWGYAVVETKDSVTVLNTITGVVERETEKAIQLTYTVGKTKPYNCDIVKTFSWHTWIPKSQIIKTDNLESAMHFNGGRSQDVDRYVASTKKKVKRSRYSVD